MKSRQDILSALEQNRDVIRELGVKELGLFGSFARDEQTDESDIDFLVEIEKKTFRSYMAVLNFLEDLVGRKVDLVMKGTIKPIIRNRVLAETIYVTGL